VTDVPVADLVLRNTKIVTFTGAFNVPSALAATADRGLPRGATEIEEAERVS
jgi:hypothetical protein